MTLWIDAQLSPALAAWINREYPDLQAHSVRSLSLRDAEDVEIFRAAREAEVVVMTKDSDFRHLLDDHGPPPKIIWVTCGNTSNRRMREILSRVLPDVLGALREGEPLVEIGEP